MGNSTTKLRLYKSGFMGLGSELGAGAHTTTRVTTADNMMLQLSTSKDPLAELARDAEIAALGSDLLDAYTGLNNFNKRHAFLEELLSVLPSSNFAQFCLMQADSPLFSELHRDFLEDTARYALMGKRKMNIHNWNSLFHHSTLKVRQSPVKFSPWFTQELKTNYSAYRFDTFYASWMGNKDGMMDLVKSFVMIYG